MIPKTIHYCWFGCSEMPDSVLKCINSWKKKLINYEFILWNEKNFNINTNDFVKEAYENKKYAFVTDYVRLYVLYNYGGIYMDTDVEVLKNLDVFLKHKAFTGCENDSMCVTGIIGAEKNNLWIKDLLDEYKNDKFILKNGKLNTIPNTKRITDITIKKYNWIPKNEYQILKGDIHIYPFDYFCAKDWQNGKIRITSDTYTIHHFAGSWISDKQKRRNKRRSIIKKYICYIIGENSFKKILNIIRKNKQ